MPISPKTIPMVMIMPAMEKALCAEGIFFVIRNEMGGFIAKTVKFHDQLKMLTEDQRPDQVQ